MKSFSYPFIPIILRERTILRPMSTVTLAYKGNEFPTRVIIDSGADYSILRHDVARGLQIPIERLESIDGPVGITGDQIQTVVADIEMTFLWKTTAIEGIVPFYIPVDPNKQPREILLERDPFFYDFRIDFRMGYTDDKTLGKFVIYPEEKKRKADRFRRPPTIRAR